ncbi:MAG: cardiolipin synthase [Prevotella sp.]|jgi:cardiolipin synthase|nr:MULTISPECIES: cardiolipin synthase [unclassified Prevotella]MCH3970445.1 cardiolipin synthase [Prevotella sp.]MCH4018181.1 cardiolipin synthase [Prevotella sp.]MCH4100498.1 cardiolipin synthase [Prevotella sp.]MCH4216054.1 cardiolipin synthase [Prevotella sp.]MCH4251005.1 cardiolipin synthase [Prevotella sp.]
MKYPKFFLLFLFSLLCLTTSAERKESFNEYNTDSSYTVQTADSMLARTLRLHGIKFTHNNSVVLLETGRQKFKDLFKAIRDARSSIHMEYFNFRNDSITHKLIKLLAKKVKQGVEVRLLFDGFGNCSNNKPLKKTNIDSIRQSGIEIYEYKPVRFPWIDDFFNRDHRKIVVIDGKIAYTGGMNVADYYITGKPKIGPWHDMHCRIDGDAVNTLQSIFLRMWKKVSHQDVHGWKYYRGGVPADYFTDLKPDTTPTRYQKMVGIINREPHTSNDIIRLFYLNAINDAHDSIEIINPYFTLSHKLMKALEKAVRRGVKVEIMLSTKCDVPLTPDCGLYNAHLLMEHGCKIWMFTAGFHHTKIIMVDGRICTVGSANLDSRSLRWDYEDNAVILDKYTTQQLCDLFDREKKQSFLLTEKKWKEWRTPWQRFRGTFAKMLSPFL